MDQRSHLTSIPLETRCKIYEYAFCNVMLKLDIDRDFSQDGEIVLKHLPGIVWVSRTIRAEALPILFAEATLHYDHPTSFRASYFSRMVPREYFPLVRYLMVSYSDDVQQPIPLSDFPALRALQFVNVNMFPPWTAPVEVRDTAAAHAALVRWAREEFNILKHARKCDWIKAAFEDPGRTFRFQMRLYYRLNRSVSCEKIPPDDCSDCCRMQTSVVDPELRVVIDDRFPPEGTSTLQDGNCEGGKGPWTLYCHPEAPGYPASELDEDDEESMRQWAVCTPM